MADVSIGATAHTEAAKAVAAAQSRTVRPAQVESLRREALAGLVGALLNLPFAVSAGVLAFAPLGGDYLAVGAATGLICAVAGGLVGALVRSPSIIVNGPSTPTALIQASFLASLLLAFEGNAAKVMAVAPLSIVLAGLWQGLFAWSGMVRIIKFTPYPVLAGFVTGLSVRTFVQQFPRFFDLPDPGTFFRAAAEGSLSHLPMAAFGLALVVVIRASDILAPRIPSMLVGLISGTIVWHALHALWPALDLGRTIGAISLAEASASFTFDFATTWVSLQNFDIVQSLLLTSATLAAVAMLDFTFTVRTAQSLTDLRISPRRDLAGQGVANLATAVLGGMPTTSSLGSAMTLYENGGRTRTASIAMSLFLLLGALVGTPLIGAMPIVVLTALLVCISWKMWDRWCVAVLREACIGAASPARTRARRNVLIVLAVMGATVFGQPILGAVVGVILSCLVFIVEMSRPIVRREFTCQNVTSKRIRSQQDRAVLTAHAGHIVVYDLEGVLFFGNADDLAASLQRLPTGVSTVILDLKHVGDVDTSGLTVLLQIARRCRENGILLALAHPHAKYRDLLGEVLAEETEVRYFHDLDAALEEAENCVLRRYEGSLEGSGLALHETDLAGGLSERELGVLQSLLKPERYAAGEALCRTGEPADRLWILTRGSVSIRAPGGYHDHRLASLGQGTSVGEMGMLDRRPRSADVVADEEVEAQVLLAEDFDALLRDEPRLGQSLLATIARLTAQRLRRTSEELRLAEA